MSQANSAIHGPYRRKVTLACGSCRKRRVKCSGSQPCTLCSESGRQCEFDSKNRARRGPRPRRNAPPQRIIHQLAARIPSIEQVTVSPQPQISADLVWHAQQEMQDAEETERCVTEDDGDDEDDDDDEDNDDFAPDPSVWKPGLEDLIYSNDTISKILPTLDIDLMCHLMHIFCTRASAQLRSLLSPAQIQHHLSQGTMSRALVLAVCASSIRFTVHKAARGPHAQGLAESMEREARKCIQASSVTWQQVNNVKTMCVLIDYEASRAHGRQAWIDIAMGRSLVQLARSHNELDAEQTQVLTVAEREQNPPPWTLNSEFRALQDDLEEYLLRHPSTFRFGSNSPSSRPSKQEDLDASISSMIWHCCVIILNRTFLPIPERRPQTTEDGGQEPPIRCIEFPNAPPLFLKERIYRCESSADAICDISQNVIRNGGFYSSALVSINRLHRSPRPYDTRILENLKLAFIVLGALKTFYAPAKEWMDVLFRAHDTNTRLRHASETIDASFNSYFSRFLDIEEPKFMPLDPKHSENTSRDAEGDENPDPVLELPHENPPESQEQQDSADGAPEWLQAYAGHLLGDIDTDEEQNLDESPRNSAVCIEPPLQARSTMTQVIPALAFHQGQDQGFIGMEPGSSEVSPVHMAGAILTSMSGGTPNFPLQAQSQQLQLHGQSDLGYDRRSMASINDPGIARSAPSGGYISSGATGGGQLLHATLPPYVVYASQAMTYPPPSANPVLACSSILPQLENIARIALAIDYNGNGYRSLLPMAVKEPAVLNAALAVAASHHSRWQRKPDTVSRKYLRAASKALRERFLSPNSIHDPVTLASMLLLVSFEVFSGSSRWKGHYDAIRGWIRSRGDCSDIEPFLKTWVCLIDTQTALNLGEPAMPELESWLDITAETAGQGEFVDAFFGCSAKLPKLMWAASRLYAASKENQTTMDELQNQVDALQAQIRSTAIVLESSPLVNFSCRSTAQPFATVGMGQEELRRRMVATAEIFRHSSHIYVHRILHGPEEPLTEEMQTSLDTAQELLTMVPDALGPGANLGWCLVVIGAEMDGIHERDYVQSRLDGLHLLGIHNTKNGQKILDEVWARRDLVTSGHAMPERWQDTMQRIGQSQILV
ncbi:fungal-specific transcription factor domain-containing protein [Penicillium expansum]|nr:fungal-specific transcription factor domain-containing protein [Penicillium expansum]